MATSSAARGWPEMSDARQSVVGKEKMAIEATEKRVITLCFMGCKIYRMIVANNIYLQMDKHLNSTLAGC
ncbi:hypothetical protein [Novacetimonas maltaceti]|uniref:hypothetical protein n=1 Tax=Novacetimonas maltaceti TaxID=1203393 RepID=UPI00142E8C8F|nr:hypothetical protein [Novacetimonas maltaceti]